MNLNFSGVGEEAVQDAGTDVDCDDYYLSYEDYIQYCDDETDHLLTDGSKLLFQKAPFETPFYLYVYTPLTVLVILFNIIVVAILCRRKLRYQIANTFLITIALTDTLTALVKLPALIYMYKSYHNLVEDVTWCEVYIWTKFYFSTTFHTISIWMTLVLSVQRTVCVLFPFTSCVLRNPRTNILTMTMIFVGAPLLHLYHVPGIGPTKMEEGECRWLAEIPCKGKCAYTWTSAFLMHFIPCAILVSCSFLLIKALREGRRRMSLSMRSSKANLKRRHLEDRRVTTIVVFLVIVFLVPEVPYGISQLIHAAAMARGERQMEVEDRNIFQCIYDVLLLLSFGANFWIYMLKNPKFRREVIKTLNLLFLRIGVNVLAKRIRRPSATPSSESSSDFRSMSTKSLSLKRKQSVLPENENMLTTAI